MRCCGYWTLGTDCGLSGCVGCWCLARGVVVDVAETVGCCGQWLLNDMGSGCQAVWEALWALATGVFALWENDEQIPTVSTVSGSLSAGVLCGLAFGLSEARCGDPVVELGCHSVLAGKSAATLLWLVSRRAGGSAVGIGMWLT